MTGGSPDESGAATGRPHDARVVSGRWAPVTAGEYDRRRRLVVVNEAVVERVAREAGVEPGAVRAAIVAHERAHAVAAPNATRAEEERAARAAAVTASGESIVRAIERTLQARVDADRTGC